MRPNAVCARKNTNKYRWLVHTENNTIKVFVRCTLLIAGSQIQILVTIVCLWMADKM